jgi:hypothetical protein
METSLPGRVRLVFVNLNLFRTEIMPLDPVQELQSLDLRNKLPISLAIATLPGATCTCIRYNRYPGPKKTMQRFCWLLEEPKTSSTCGRDQPEAM